MEDQNQLYCYDLQDPHAFLQNPYKHRPNFPLKSEWYENRNQPDYINKLIYRYDKSIPQVV